MIELHCDEWFLDDEDIVVVGSLGFTPQHTTAASCVIRSIEENFSVSQTAALDEHNRAQFMFESGSVPVGEYHVGFYCEGLSASDTFTVYEEACYDDGVIYALS